jgi:DNA-binding PadR family transcriptional regulator
MGGGHMMRAGRILAQGDLQLIALALIAEQPRHGYEIIKVLEEKTSGWYSPSPGIVYPTLTYLEEVGYVTAQTEGAKKLYTITEEGRAHLEANRDLADTVFDRLASIGERVARWRRMSGRDSDDRRAVPPLVEAALNNLREAALTRIDADADAESRVVEILVRAATDMKRN